MFIVRFRRIRGGRRKNFSLSRQNHLSLTFDISHKEYICLGKLMTWMTLTQGDGCGIR